MDMWELIQIINRDCYDVDETIQMINELIREIDKDPKKFTKELYNNLKTLAKNTNRCPKCGRELVAVEKYNENREYQGTPCTETIYKYGCEFCDYIEE